MGGRGKVGGMEGRINGGKGYRVFGMYVALALGRSSTLRGL